MGEHIDRATDDEDWTRVGRPQRRVGVFVFPSPAAASCDPAAWRLLVDCARSSLALLAPGETFDPPDSPREVFVVRPPDASEDVAVFERERDAHAFWRTYGEAISDIERAVVCDAELAARMIAERLADEAEADAAREHTTCLRCLARAYRGEYCVCAAADPERGC